MNQFLPLSVGSNSTTAGYVFNEINHLSSLVENITDKSWYTMMRQVMMRRRTTLRRKQL